MKTTLQELTAGEARDLLARRPILLLPMGSLEDQGPHAPMGDYLSAARIGELIAARANEAGVLTFCLPVLPFGGADYFGAMPGGIALKPETLAAVMKDIFDCLLRHGLDRIVILNGHNGNVSVINEVTQELRRNTGAVVPSLYLWKIASNLLPEIVGADKARASLGHGAEPMGSVVEHLFPELLRADMTPGPSELKSVMGMKGNSFNTAIFEGIEVGMPFEYDSFAPNGVGRGDPRLASAETGALLVEKLVDLAARFVRHYAQQTAT